MNLPSQRKAWGLTQTAFDKLLAQLDADRDHAGQKYESIRLKLVRFFEWRGSAFPEDNADETINRVARRIDQGEEIRDLKNYFYGVARMRFLEALKEEEKEAVALGHLPQQQTDSEEGDKTAAQLECLQMCLNNLSAENRELIIEYYRMEKGAKIENRQALAERFGIPLNALRIRTHRIRAKIEECIKNCLKPLAREMK